MVASSNFLAGNKLVAWLLAIIVLHGGALTSQAQDQRTGRPAQPSTRPAAARGAAGELAAGFDKQAVPVGQLLSDVTVLDADGDCTVTQSPYGTLPDGSQISCFTLSNGRRMRATVINYGATITGVFVPDASGTIDNVVLHLDSLDDYLRGHPLFGSLVGRYANRIANAAFTIDGTRYEVTRNAGQNHIHGGRLGFQKIVWKARVLPDRQRAAVEFTHTSPNGHEGYPGRLNVRVVYALTAANELVLEYFARTDKPTHVNLTNHAYWNLAGAGSGDVLGHRMRINADRSLVASESRFPTGEIRSVLGTPLDFTTVHPIGARIEQVMGSNYDDCYVLNKKVPGKLTLAARVLEPQSGRVMEVSTTQPGVQFYTAKGLSKKYRADGHPYGPYYGFCLETQHFPDTPNHSQFPSTLLRPGQTYHEMTVYRFATSREP